MEGKRYTELIIFIRLHLELYPLLEGVPVRGK